MILIGEKLNSSIPSTLEAFEARNEAAVLSLIQLQEKAGAAYLDVNTSLCANEQDALLWVAGLIRAHSKCGIMIDTADPEVMAQAVQAAQGTDFILNSATIDERFEEVTSLAKKSNAALVALPISLEGQEPGLKGRCANIDKLIGKLRQAGIPDKHIFLDVLAETLATDTESAIAYTAASYPQVKTTCGLSNVSFGLPRRGLINSAFLTTAVFSGLSSAILDPSSRPLRDALAAALAIAGQDDFCMDYITYLREQEQA